MKLIFMRHGESIGNVTYGFISGRSDPAGLTHKGRVQVIRSAWELHDEKIDRIIVSPVARAQETARILHRYFPSAQFETAEWLTELDHGIFEGRRWWEVIHKVPVKWREQHGSYQTAFPQGESMEDLAHRVWAGYQNTLTNVKEDETVLFVSHQAVISSIRYGLKYGDPALINSSVSQKQYVQFLNDIQLPNAGFFISLPTRNKKQDSTSIEPYENVKPRHNNISWYVHGLLETENEPEAKRMETASGNAVYHVKISDTASRMVKVLRGTDSQAACRQRKVYEYLKKKHIHAPVIEQYDTSHAFYKNDVFIQDYIQGDTAGDCFKRSKGTCQPLLESIYAALNQIHSLPVEEVSSFWIPSIEEVFLDWKTFMQYNINLSLHKLQLCDLQDEIKDYLYQEVSHLSSYLLQGKYTLAPIHGDAGTGNFITCGIKDNACSLLRIIDFEWARLGDPLWDLAYFWGWVERSDVNTASQWYTILQKQDHNLRHINQYRLLFHIWTVRDMYDYKNESIRQSRGKKSLEILRNIKLP